MATACSLLKATFLESDVSALRSIKKPSLQGLMSGLGLFARSGWTEERNGVRWSTCEQEDEGYI